MSNKTSFWTFLQSNDTVIPILQRDYAQGRRGKAYIRQSFLANIKQALDAYVEGNGSALTLDFVYGTNEGTRFLPLDGQQRLTTLWLLHWYVALLAGQLQDSVPMLQRFTYETRISSREFCRQLCCAENFFDYETGHSVSRYIRQRTWFHASWQHDPTIRAMLGMLSGEDGEADDGIEKVFGTGDGSRFAAYWNSLTATDASIVFYLLPLQDFGLTDDLYIKMNARGKQLTPFENFKADLIGYITGRAEPSNADHEAWRGLLHPTEGIPIKLDTTWTDLFWRYRSADCSIDDIYFAFINRFFWNELMMAKDAEGRYVLPVGKGTNRLGETVNGIENESPHYRHLNAARPPYHDLAPYRFANGEIPLQAFTDLRSILNRVATFGTEMPTPAWMSDFRFIPRYDGTEHDTTGITQVQRIAFFALCKYFKEGDADAESLHRWMRVVCNLISIDDERGQAQIRSTEAVRSAMERIDTLDSHHVLDSLCTSTWTENTALGAQWREEVEKARQMMGNSGQLRSYPQGASGNYSTWEEAITDAERYAFFRGAIRFLFTDCNGLVDWADFPRKWSNAQQYFRSDAASGDSCMNIGYENARLLQSLLSRVENSNTFNGVLWWNHRVFNNRAATWKYYLLHPMLRHAIHALLMGNTSVVSRNVTANDEMWKRILQLLCETPLLSFVMDRIPNSWIRHDYHGHWAIYPSSTGVFLDAERRNAFLLHTKGVQLCQPQEVVISDTELLYGNDISFSYGGRTFQWNADNFIYLMQTSDTRQRMIKDSTAANDDDRYCRIFTDTDDHTLLQHLTDL